MEGVEKRILLDFKVKNCTEIHEGFTEIHGVRL